MLSRPWVKHRWLRRSVWSALSCAIILAVLYLYCPWVSLYPEGLRYSHVLEDRHGKVIHIALTGDGKYRIFTPLHDISPDLMEATLVQEDRHYYAHPGFNPMSLARGFWGAVTGQRLGGGSTLTMQYARLRFGLRTRTFRGKLEQILCAIQLERHYTKQELLEAYLNLAPYGSNVEGAGAASWLWCRRQPSEITRREAVALAMLPQSPTRRRPNQAGTNKSLAEAQQRLLLRMQTERNWRADPLDAAYTLRTALKPPREAPHLARRIFGFKSAPRDDDEEPLPFSPIETHGETTVPSTLDIEFQHSLERSLTDYVNLRQEVGIRNACAMLVHAPTREVLAYVGSAGFYNAGIQGQVDGVISRRSPGSALKPFVYCLAMQQGLIHPHTLLRDAKLSFGEYNPENFDRRFCGPIPAADALYNSRNIPAVWLTQHLEEPGLYGFLKGAGLVLPHSEEYYGLSLSLGGAEVSMEELAGLYALLADDGRPRRLRYTKASATVSDPALSQPPLLTPEARFLTRTMLKPHEEEGQFDDPSVSWKTGTSHGFRDAWAAGIRGDYVLVIWIGNFNGKSNHAFIARECAAPLLFQCFRHLRLPVRPTAPPPGVREVELCAVSGQLPSPNCQHRTHGWFIPGISSIAPCSIHREVCVDPQTGWRVSSDDGRPGLKRQILEFWPPDMLELFREAGLPRREPPPLEPSAKSLTSANHQEIPRIASPKAAVVYTLRARDPQRQSIPLRADAAPGVHRVYWFAGPQFLGATPPVESLMWQPSAGKWKLQVLDDQGRSASCEVRVEMVE